MKICSKKYILTCENQLDSIIHILGIVLDQINYTGRRPLLSVLDIPVHALIRCMMRVRISTLPLSGCFEFEFEIINNFFFIELIID